MRKTEAWNDLQADYAACRKCKIGEMANKHVFGKGHLVPDILFIGEGPGKLEDIKGAPFVGLAGQLLSKAIRIAGGGRGLPSEPYPVRCFFTNLVCCRPCDGVGKDNRAPAPDEIANCMDRLEQTVNILNPPVVVLLGRVPQQALVQAPFIKDRQVFSLRHPAYICRLGGIGSDAFLDYILEIRSILHDANIQPKD